MFPLAVGQPWKQSSPREFFWHLHTPEMRMLPKVSVCCAISHTPCPLQTLPLTEFIGHCASQLKLTLPGWHLHSAPLTPSECCFWTHLPAPAQTFLYRSSGHMVSHSFPRYPVRQVHTPLPPSPSLHVPCPLQTVPSSWRPGHLAMHDRPRNPLAQVHTARD